MARILFINSVCNGSTGSICKNLYKLAEEAGHECCIAYGRGSAPQNMRNIRIGNDSDIYLHGMKARLFDASGFGSENATKKFLLWMEEYKPDIIHMHNLHGYYLDIKTFFGYLKKHPEIKKVWTLHDCWAFTGHCAYYTYAECEKWKTGCGACPCKNDYPKSFLDHSKKNYKKKRDIFRGVKNIILVTPSIWLQQDVLQSYMGEYKVRVINNGIDTSVFRPQPSKIKEKYGIFDKKIILGVASVWDRRKGLDTFIQLSKKLPKDYQVVLIGLSDEQIKALPPQIIGIGRTENVYELVEWYSAAEFLFNPTMEDNYPTVNLEAQACGTFVVAYDSGGTKETIKGSNGKIVNSLDEVLEFLETEFTGKICEYSLKEYDWKYCFQKYIELYNEE